MDISWGAKMPSIVMPGTVKHLAVVDDVLWAACEVNRRWWEFWRPTTYIRWYCAAPPEGE